MSEVVTKIAVAGFERETLGAGAPVALDSRSWEAPVEAMTA